jgi:succinate dehydrogenase / fumarate reductase, membrane anchor subunit
MMSDSLRTPLSRARGLGSAKSGVGHFIQQRASAMFLAILLPWFGISVILGTDGDYASVQAWLSQPFNAVGTLLLVLTGVFHMRLGLQVVIEDYIHKPVTRTLCLLANTAIPAIIAIMSALSVAKIFVGA